MFQKNQENKSDSYEDASVFERIAESKDQYASAFPIPGVYPILSVTNLKMTKSRKGDQLFIAEFEVFESDVPERPRGSTLTWMANFRHDPTPSAVKTFFSKMMDVPSEEIDPAGLKHAIGSSQPCRGRLVRLEAVAVKTNSDRDFTKCIWKEIPKSLQERADELRGNAGFPPF